MDLKGGTGKGQGGASSSEPHAEGKKCTQRFLEMPDDPKPETCTASSLTAWCLYSDAFTLMQLKFM